MSTLRIKNKTLRKKVEQRKADNKKANQAKKSRHAAKDAQKAKRAERHTGLTTAEIRAKKVAKGVVTPTKNKGKGSDKGGNKGGNQGKGNDNKGGNKGGNQGGNKGGNKGKGNKQIPNVLEDLNPNQRDQKIFNRVLDKDGALTKKIQSYQDIYGGDSKESKNYLKQLKDNALQRMKINPESYGRSKEGTAFADLSMAEQYDKNSNNLISRLEKPLTSYIDDLDDSKGLNMFDSNKELKFDSAKLKKFASSDFATTLRTKAKGLGVANTAANRTTKTLEGIGKVKNKKSADLKSKFAQDLKFIV